MTLENIKLFYELWNTKQFMENEFSYHSNLKILNPTQMLQRLPVALSQVTASNTSQN